MRIDDLTIDGRDGCLAVMENSYALLVALRHISQCILLQVQQTCCFKSALPNGQPDVVAAAVYWANMSLFD